VQLNGKRALITGAATGIGRSLAELFADEGARLVLADVNDEEGRYVARGVGAKFVHTDVSRAADIEAMITSAADELGGIDVLVNNAGIVRCGAIETFSESDWYMILDVNAKSVFLATRYALPHFARAEGGSVVNTASIAALRPGSGVAAYAASKGAVVSLTRALARELAPKRIRVNCVCPGWIDTSFNESLIDYLGGDESLSSVVARIPLGLMGMPREAAAAILFLASDASSFVTGQMIVVDGGLV
jgi:dihydroanticapsin dehydrogenase